MKLLDREPTPEMLSIISNEKEVFNSAESLYAALYDAAPEADAQAEIAKRDERIKAVIAKCKWALENCGQAQGSDDMDDGTFCRIDLVEDALAAIKEIEK